VQTLSEKAPLFEYRFPAEVNAWHDGDTCTVHRGFAPGVEIHGEKVRVQGINAPELSAAGGTASRDYAGKICPPGTLVTLVANKEDKYGRFLARIIMPDGTDFSDLMIAAKQAIPYLV
jgi:endonuclease YncB( thermonuclease family)